MADWDTDQHPVSEPRGLLKVRLFLNDYFKFQGTHGDMDNLLTIQPERRSIII